MAPATQTPLPPDPPCPPDPVAPPLLPPDEEAEKPPAPPRPPAPPDPGPVPVVALTLEVVPAVVPSPPQASGINARTMDIPSGARGVGAVARARDLVIEPTARAAPP